MRKFGLVITLSAAAFAGTACQNTGFDGSWAAQFYGGFWSASNNASGAAALTNLTFVISETGTDGWWHPESLFKYNGCSSDLAVQLYSFADSGSTVIAGRYFDTGELSAHPWGDVYSYVRDDSADNFVSGPTEDQINAGVGGYTSGVTNGNLCGNGTGGPFGEGSFVDTLVARQLTPLNGYYSTGVSENMSFSTLPAYANDAANHDLSANGPGDRLPLATRIEILKSIDVNNDIVRTVLAGGRVREDVRARLTSLTIDGETFVPSQETAVTIRDFSVIALNLSDPSYKAMAAWVADRLQVSVDAGREPSGSVTINDSLTVSSQELSSLMPDTKYIWAGQPGVDRLRAFAGSLVQDNTRRVRFDRRFAEDVSADFGLR